jgi:hypothetical protein
MILIFRVTCGSFTVSCGGDEKGITAQRSSICIPIEVDKLLCARSNAAMRLIFHVAGIAFVSCTVSGGGDKQALAALRLLPIRCVPTVVDELFRARSNTAMIVIFAAPARVTFGSFTVSRGGDQRVTVISTTLQPRVVWVDFRIVIDELGGARSDAAMILIFRVTFDPVTVSCGGDQKGFSAKRSSLCILIKVVKFLRACCNAAVLLIFQGGIAGIAFGSFTVSGGGNKQALAALRVLPIRCVHTRVDELRGALGNAAMLLIFCVANSSFTVSRGGDEPRADLFEVPTVRMSGVRIPLLGIVVVGEPSSALGNTAMILIFRVAGIAFGSCTVSGGGDKQALAALCELPSQCVPAEVDKLRGALSNAAMRLIFHVAGIACGSVTMSRGGDKQTVAARLPTRRVAVVDE